MSQTFENMNTEEFITHMEWVIDQINSNNRAFLVSRRHLDVEIMKESIRRLETLVSRRHLDES